MGSSIWPSYMSKWGQRAEASTPAYDPKIAAAKQTARQTRAKWVAETLQLCTAQFKEVLPTRTGGLSTDELLSETLSRARWKNDEYDWHGAWQEEIKRRVRHWDEENHRAFQVYLASCIWAAYVEEAPVALKEKALKILSVKSLPEANREAELRRREEEAEQERIDAQWKAEREEARRLEAEQRAALAKLDDDVQELLLDEERSLVGGGSW